LAWVCALGIAAGLSLYATLTALAFLGLAGLAPLPARLSGLEAPLVFAPVLIFYAVEASLARSDGVDVIADATQAGIRPLGAGILAGAAVAPFGPDVSWLMAAIAGVLALWAHTGRSGLVVLTRTSAHRDRVPTLVTAAEGSAACIVLLGALWPQAAVGLAALVFLAPIVRLPALWNAARAGRYAAWAILSYPFHGRAWRGGETLPPKLARRLRAAAGADARVLRLAPALARRVAGIPTLARGWLAFTSRGAYFLYQGFYRTGAARLAPGRTLAQTGRVFDLLRVEDSNSDFLLPKSAPRPDSLPRSLLESAQ
jgi:hypothetical protein